MSDEFTVDENDCLQCRCSKKYHISVFPIWNKTLAEIRILKRIMRSVRTMLGVIDEKEANDD